MKKEKFIVCLSAVFLFFFTAMPTFAADEMPDLSRMGSIRLTIQDTVSKEPASGGSLELIQVASVVAEDGYVFEYVEIFSGCGLPLDALESETLANELVDYAESRNIEGTHAEISPEGKAAFLNLELGLYLIIQDVESEHGLQVNPFLVTIPMNEGEYLIYDVDASPKAGFTGDTEQPDDEKPEDEQPDQEQPELSLPQTGQLWWPVPLLAAAGMLVFALGWMIWQNTDKKNERKKKLS